MTQPPDFLFGTPLIQSVRLWIGIDGIELPTAQL